MSKKVLGIFALAALLFGSCSQTEDLGVNGLAKDGEGNVNISLAIPDALAQTKATTAAQRNSARGGVTNVDMTKYDLRYQLAVYNIDKVNDPVLVVPAQKFCVDDYQEISYPLHLVKKHSYRIVVWADFVEQGSEDDLHYNTTNFEEITCKDDHAASMNDESRDAYFITYDIENLGESAVVTSLVLRRPFSKVRVVTNDWNKLDTNMPVSFKVKYYGEECKRFTGINAITGKPARHGAEQAAEEAANNDNGNDNQAPENDDEPTADDGNGETGDVEKEVVIEQPTEYDMWHYLPAKEDLTDADSYNSEINREENYYGQNYDADEHNRTLVVDYLMTDLDEQTPIHILFEAYNTKGEKVKEFDFSTNIPIERNYLTTIMGNLLTTDTHITISIDEAFTNEYVWHGYWFLGDEIAPENFNVNNPEHLKAWYTAQGLEPEYPAEVDEANKIYNIKNRAEFAWFSVNATNSELAGATIRLGGDIDMYGIQWIPVSTTTGNHTTYTFDGQGHALRNFDTNMYGGIYGGGKAYYGVFGRFWGTIKNVYFENITINGLEGFMDEHNNETRYAGCIGNLINGDLINVHASNVVIKNTGSAGTRLQGIGGLVGFFQPYSGGHNSMVNCSIDGLDLRGYVGAALIGQAGPLYIDNCSAENVTIRLSKHQDDEGNELHGDDLVKANLLGGFVSRVNNTSNPNKNIEITNSQLPTNLKVLNDDDGVENTEYLNFVKDKWALYRYDKSGTVDEETGVKDYVYKVIVDGTEVAVPF